MAYSPNDIATITARIEFAVKGGAQIVYVAPDGLEHRAQVSDKAIIAVEAGPLKAGDKVSKGKGKTAVAGEVVHRVEDKAWVKWDDASESLEAVDSLNR